MEISCVERNETNTVV